MVLTSHFYPVQKMFVGRIHPHTNSITGKERCPSSSITPGTLIQISHIVLPLMYSAFTSLSQIVDLETNLLCVCIVYHPSVLEILICFNVK